MVAVLFALCASPAFVAAQPLPLPDVAPPPAIVNKIGIDQKLGDALPLDLPFVDEAGQAVRLGDYFGNKPVALLLVYYECPSLCNQVLNGVTGALKAVAFDVSDEFDVVVISIDPTETPALAAKKKQSYLNLYGRPQSAGGWHFLTGAQEAIEPLAGAVGFRYAYDENTGQYAHAAAVFVATPAGKLSHYLFGIEYSPNDLRLALVEAADGRIGSVVDQVMLLCFKYDMASGKYGWAITRSVQTAGVVTVVAMGLAITYWLRRERRGTLAPAAAAVAPSARGAVGV